MRPIVKIPHPVLSGPAKPVTSFDRKLHAMITDMKETLIGAKRPKGVGLAAPQIGEPYRVFIMRPDVRSEMRVFINPQIVSRDERPQANNPKKDKLEGCLSIPDIWGDVDRSISLTLRYQDEKGAEHTESFTGFPAVIIQHEVDHLNGILFTQRVIEQKGKLYEPEKDKGGKETLKEIHLA
jgi:peptide deformylase